jgi:lincosamide nucleotidyltransferase A/C/D/E
MSCLENPFPSARVVELYKTLDSLGVMIWIDGGWGVDALLGRQTRPHGDLDIGIEQNGLPQLLGVLEGQGFKEVRRDGQWNFVMRDGKGHDIDIHVFVVHAAGTPVEGIMYPAASLEGKPRGSPQIRPMRITSKPANGADSGQTHLYPARRHLATVFPQPE